MNMTILTVIAVLFVAAGKADKFKTNWMGMNVAYSLNNHQWIYQGEMIIGDEQHGVYNTSDVWPDGIIPYEMDDDLSNVFNETIWNEWNEAIHDFHSKTSLSFIPRTSQSDYLWIYNGNGCNSRVGFERGSGKHSFSLTKDCVSANEMVHQLEHVVGLHDQVCGKKDPSKQGCRRLSVSDVDCINNHLYHPLSRPPLLLNGLTLISKHDDDDEKVTFSSVGYEDIKIVYKIKIQTFSENAWFKVDYSCSNHMKYNKLVQYTQMMCPKIEIHDLPSDCDNLEKVMLYFEGQGATLSNLKIYGMKTHSTIRRLQSSSESSGSSSSSSSDEQVATMNPTINPTDNPTFHPTIDPTIDPSIHPTINPTDNPSFDPTINPTSVPTENPTINPTLNPTSNPTVNPTEPTASPTNEPTDQPTEQPTEPFVPTPPSPPIPCGDDCTGCSESSEDCIADEDCKFVGDAGEEGAECTFDCGPSCGAPLCQTNGAVCDRDPNCGFAVGFGCFGV